MRVLSTVAFLSAAASCAAFTVLPGQNAVGSATPSSAVSMGMFDFFSAEAKEERQLKKQREVEEQERLQEAIMERRRNPEKMDEYEAKVALRRQLRMKGDDAGADNVEIFDNLEKQTLLDGTQGQDL
jgi:succinate dehydrogenase/fumarate reductase flavoprotein subunit